MLKLQDVKKSYAEPGGGRLAILDVPRLELQSGEQVVLRGPSGCGKTTLLHVIAGISRADSGQVEISGVNISQLPEAARDRFRARHIGYVFQTFNLLPGFTALENVLLGMTFTGQKINVERAKQLLDRVGLSHRLSHQPAMLSVGEQQRVAVARAMANKPRLLLADEPTANVDRGHQQQIVDLIRETCQAEDVSLLLVTHTPEVADQFERKEDLEKLNLLARAAT
jgi:putative ABC transport system ATP-binding protein